MARKRKNPKKIKNGGSGTRVGNLLRKAKTTVNNLSRNNTANVVGAFSGGPAGIPRAVANIASNILNKNKVNKLQKGFDFNNPVQNAVNESRTFQRNLNQPNMPDSGLFTNQSNQSQLNVVNSVKNFQKNRNSGGAGVQYGPDVPEGYVLGAEETIDPQGRSTGMGGSPASYNPSQSFNSKPSAGPTESPMPEFQKSSVSSIGATTGAGVSVPGSQAGGAKQLGIAGTQIEDPVLKNLLEQYGKDAQLDVDIDEIRDKNRRQSQAEIDAINAVYSDLVGRAVRTGKEAEGSERALQARSGTLPSSFGQGAMQAQAENTNQNVGEIENQRTQAISEIYAQSENRAMQEFTNLQNLRNSGVDGYLKAMELQKSSMETGLDETAQYIALQGLSGDDLGVEGLQKLAKDWNTTPMAVYNRIATKKTELDNAVIERAGAMKDAGMGTETNMGSDFDYFSKEAIAMSVLPTQLRNSDTEAKYYKEGIAKGLEQGLDPYEIADVLMGYNVQNKDEFSDSIRQMIGYSDLPTNKVADIARNINAGKPVVALNIIEKNLYDQARKLTESDYIAESNVTNAIQRVDELTEKINNLKKSPIGVTKGTIAEFMGRVRGKEASKIKTDVTVLVEQMKKELLGSAVTPSEERFLEARLPKISDQPDVFMYKLEALKSEPLRRLNSIRTQFNMVPLDRESLFDKNLRVEDYYSMGASMPQQQQYSTAGGGDSNWNW